MYSLEPAPSMADVTAFRQDVSAACRIGGHRLCQEHPVIRCACPCHPQVSSVVWRRGGHVIVTYDNGEVEMRRGSRHSASELAEEKGLRSASGTGARQEWARQPDGP